MNDKKEDEIYCIECGKPIKKKAVICPYCGVQIKELEISSRDTSIKVKSEDAPKNKVTAVVLAALFGFWSWAYTYGRNAKYFWIGFGISLFLGLFFIPSIGVMMLYETSDTLSIADGLAAFYFALLGIWAISSWLWALIDNAVKPSSFYENYPNG